MLFAHNCMIPLMLLAEEPDSQTVHYQTRVHNECYFWVCFHDLSPERQRISDIKMLLVQRASV